MSFISEPGFFDRYEETEEIELRTYQEDSISELRENIRAGKRTQILASMVGSGKTVMGAFLLRECWQKGKRGMFVVDRISLLDQTSAVFDRYGIPHGVIQSGHARYRPGELIQVASMQTLQRRGWPDADLIIVDEAHSSFTTLRKRINRPGCKTPFIGLTATPFTKGLGKLYEAIVNVTTGKKLTEEGFLVPFDVWAASEPDMRGVKVVAGEWEEKETSKRAVKIVGDVVSEYQRHGGDGKAICFGVDVAHCEELQRQFFLRGIKAALYTYLTGEEERVMMLKEFRKPDSGIRVLLSVAALSKGFDVPDVTVLMMCRPLKSSFTEFVQSLGRVLRPSPGKSRATVLDLAGNFMRHYPALVEFMEDGVNHLDDGKPKASKPSVSEEKKPRKCPRCKHVIAAGSHCPACGYIYPPRKSVQHENGELAGFDGKAAIKYDKAAKAQLYGELLWIAKERGYQSGWVGHTYRKQTGVWPKGFSDIRYPASAATLVLVRAMHRKTATKSPRPVSAPKRAEPESDLFI